MRLRLAASISVILGAAVLATPAAATPVATSDASYSGLGRVFPDPLAGCQPSAGACDPNAQGNVPATQFIQYQEFVNALTYMNSSPDWSKYMEVEVLDGKIGANASDRPLVILLATLFRTGSPASIPVPEEARAR